VAGSNATCETIAEAEGVPVWRAVSPGRSARHPASKNGHEAAKRSTRGEGIRVSVFTVFVRIRLSILRIRRLAPAVCPPIALVVWVFHRFTGAGVTL
jgi:hypothetical protein